jgi:predicted O-linked N-acetylglucosamine transferase (SPINDLY family)
VKNSTLSLSSSRLESQISKDVILSRFAMHGIFGDRIRFIDQTESNSEHLQKYNDIDIALDTFPYNGTTTTAEALLMGVPVSTFLGRRHSERVSSSILQNVEENRWIADSIDNYVDNTVEMSQDLESLVIGSTVLRDKYLEFNNPINYARDFKKVIEQILN